MNETGDEAKRSFGIRNVLGLIHAEKQRFGMGGMVWGSGAGRGDQRGDSEIHIDVVVESRGLIQQD